MDDETLPDIAFPNIGDDADDADGGDGGDEQEKSVADQIAESQAAMRAEFETERKWYREAIDRLVSGQRPAAAPQGEQDAEPTVPDRLPDPTTKPKDFATAIANIVRDQATHVSKTAKSATDRQTAIAAAVNQFYDDNRDLVGYDELVDGAWKKEAARLKGRGVDPTQAYIDDPSMGRRIADAARERARELGITLKAQDADQGGDQGDTDQGGTTPARKSGGGTATRTAGVSSGTPGGGKGGGKSGDKAVPFTSQLKSLQAESGYY